MKGSLCKVHWIHSMHWSFTNCYKALFRPPYLDLLAGNSQWPQSMSDPYINWFRIYIKFGTDMGLGPISYANRHIKLDILIYNIYQFWQKLDTILYEEVIIWHWQNWEKSSLIYLLSIIARIGERSRGSQHQLYFSDSKANS